MTFREDLLNTSVLRAFVSFLMTCAVAFGQVKWSSSVS